MYEEDWSAICLMMFLGCVERSGRTDREWQIVPAASPDVWSAVKCFCRVLSLARIRNAIGDESHVTSYITSLVLTDSNAAFIDYCVSHFPPPIAL